MEDAAMHDRSDDDLMSLYRQGSEVAFRTLFDRYCASVYNYARLLLRDPVQAEDVVQETFLSVARAAERYAPQGHFRTWLMRIARNRCLNLLEMDRVRRSVDPQCTPHADSPARRAETAEHVAIVREAIASLPERQREAIVLYAFDSMSYQEVARVLDMPINTVKTMIHRGRAALARALARTRGCNPLSDSLEEKQEDTL